MNKYHKLADLAPRDIVARAIYNESKDGQVYLDIRHKGAKYIKERFPYIYDQLWWYDIKMDKDLIPVSPAAHFLCGGVHTDLQGRTNIPGLFAFGEVAHTGVHGANRLASNSLLECMVFSSRAVNSAKNYVRKLQVTSYKLQKIPKTNKPKTNTYKKEIQKKMWENVGIIREPKKLESTFEKLVRIERKIHDVYNKGINREIIELKNLCITAILITKAALEREKSVGTHYIK